MNDQEAKYYVSEFPDAQIDTMANARDKLLQRFGFCRLVWHPALVRLALMVILFTLLFSYGRFE